MSMKSVAVDVETMGHAYTLSTRTEIVLSVGAFQSHQLLMVSGVGPAATLKTNGIPPRGRLARCGTQHAGSYHLHLFLLGKCYHTVGSAE